MAEKKEDLSKAKTATVVDEKKPVSAGATGTINSDGSGTITSGGAGSIVEEKPLLDNKARYYENKDFNELFIKVMNDSAIVE